VVVVISAAFGLLNVAAAGLRYRTVPRELLSRVSGVWRTSACAASGAGALVGGAVASREGIQAPFVMSATLGVVATVLWLTVMRKGPTAAWAV
jgi:predicted MFS family arabinose efflux permease